MDKKHFKLALGLGIGVGVVCMVLFVTLAEVWEAQADSGRSDLVPGGGVFEVWGGVERQQGVLADSATDKPVGTPGGVGSLRKERRLHLQDQAESTSVAVSTPIDADLRAGPGWKATNAAMSTSGGVANGGFENGPDGSWEENSSNDWPLILHEEELPVLPHSGTWAAWLGGADDEIAALQQHVRLPTRDATLAYWVWIASDETECDYDRGAVIINGHDVVADFGLCEPNLTNGWVKRSEDLNAYAGRTVLLDIRATTDGSLNSNLFVDEVSLSGAAPELGRVLVPMVTRYDASPPPPPPDEYAAPCSPGNNYCEPYNTWSNAYGRLRPGTAYRAYPEDPNDYYFFVVDQPSSYTVRVTNYAAVGQVVVRSQDLREVAKDVEVPPNRDGTMNVPLPNLAAGKYYIQVFTSAERNQDTLYELTLNH